MRSGGVLLVSGSRTATSLAQVRGWIIALRPDRVIVGDARDGVDPMTAEACRELGVHYTPIFRACWDRNGRKAGILRNLRMLDEKPDVVLAIWDGKSRGTKHVIDEAGRRGIPVRVVNAITERWRPETDETRYLELMRRPPPEPADEETARQWAYTGSGDPRDLA